MLRGIYTSSSALQAADARQQVLAASLANADTPGYKSNDVSMESFEQVLAALYDGPTPGSGVEPAGQRFDLSQGAVRQTGNPLDVALDGDGFFVLDGATGSLYTRAGRFSRDAQGVLRSVDGLAVEGVDGNPITVNGTNVQVAPDGTVLADGNPAGQIRVVSLDPSSLSRAGTSAFTSTASPTASAARVVGGALEDSNVDVTAVMTSMTMLLRAFQAGRQSVQMQNDTLGETVNQIGQLR